MKFYKFTSLAREHCRSLFFFSLSLHSIYCKDSYKWLRFMISNHNEIISKKYIIECENGYSVLWLFKETVYILSNIDRMHSVVVKNSHFSLLQIETKPQTVFISNKISITSPYLPVSFWRLSIRKYHVNVPFGVFTLRAHTLCRAFGFFFLFNRGMQNGIGRKFKVVHMYQLFS